MKILSSRALALSGGDRKRAAVAAMNIGTVLQEVGRAVEATERYRESLREAELLGDDAGLARAANKLLNCLVFLNSLAEASYWIERSDGIAQRHDTAILLAYNEALRGKIHHRKGELESARRHLLLAVDRLREMGGAGEAAELLVELGLVARTAGDAAGVLHYANAAEQQAKTSGACSARTTGAPAPATSRPLLRLAGPKIAALAPQYCDSGARIHPPADDLGIVSRVAVGTKPAKLGASPAR